MWHKNMAGAPLSHVSYPQYSSTLAHTSPLFSQKLLFAGSHSQLVQVPLAHCSKYRFCADCILARDPYCAWNVNTSRCVSAGGPSG